MSDDSNNFDKFLAGVDSVNNQERNDIESAVETGWARCTPAEAGIFLDGHTTPASVLTAKSCWKYADNEKGVSLWEARAAETQQALREMVEQDSTIERVARVMVQAKSAQPHMNAPDYKPAEKTEPEKPPSISSTKLNC